MDDSSESTQKQSDLADELLGQEAKIVLGIDDPERLRGIISSSDRLKALRSHLTGPLSRPRRVAGEPIHRDDGSGIEAVEGCLRRIEALDPQLNAFVADRRDAARQEGVIQDRRREGSIPQGGLDGLILAVKDNIDVAGLATTAGSRHLSGDAVAQDADVVAALRGEGAIVIGKTNLDELAYGGQTSNDLFGPTRNPFDALRSPGGSSGGSAVAVATGMADAGIGTDTGGSIRNPAAICGVVGFKPTHGTISVGGVVPLARSMDTVGFLSRSVADCAHLYAHGRTRVHGDLSPQEFLASLGSATSPGPVVGLVNELVESSDQVVQAMFAHTVQSLTTFVDFKTVSLPGIESAWLAGTAIIMGEAAAEWGHVLAEDGSAIGDPVRALLDLAGLLRASEFVVADRIREEFGEQLRDCLTGVDALMMPTMGSLPSEESLTDSRSHDSEPCADAALHRLRSSVRFTIPWNVAGCPAIAVPCQQRGDTPPFSVQIVAAPHNDSTALNIATTVESVFRC